MAIRTYPALKIVTAATAEPVLATEAKAHLRETATNASIASVIANQITTAREVGEEYTGRAFMRQTWDAKLDAFPTDADGCDAPILLPKPPLQSVTSITYVNATGGSSTLTATAYRVDITSEPGRITPAYNSYWPAAREVSGAVTVRFVCGYATSATATAGKASAVPRRIKQAMLLHVGDQYENRENTLVGTIAEEMPLGAKALYNSLRVVRFQ